MTCAVDGQPPRAEVEIEQAVCQTATRAAAGPARLFAWPTNLCIVSRLSALRWGFALARFLSAGTR